MRTIFKPSVLTIIGLLANLVNCHLFMGDALDNVQRFADEFKLTEMLGGKAGRPCDVSDGPFCAGLETLGDSEVDQGHAKLHQHLKEVIRQNQKLNQRSNDRGKMEVGVKVVESQALFQLSF